MRSNSKAYIELRRRAFEWLIAPPPPEGAFMGSAYGYGLSREQAEKLLATKYAQRVLAIVGLTLDEKVARIAEQKHWNRQLSPARGAARQRLLKVHADVSRKLWAKSPLPRDMNERASKLNQILRKEPGKFTPGQVQTAYREVALLANELHNVAGDSDIGWKYIERDLGEASSRLEGGHTSFALNKIHSALQTIRGVLERTTHGPRHGDGYYRSGMSKTAYPVQVLNVDSSGFHVRGLGKRFRNRTFTIVGSEFTTYLPVGTKVERV